MRDTFLRSRVFFFIASVFFISGINEYVVLPTSWLYVRSLGGTIIFLGIVLAIPNITSLLFSAPIGLISDKFRCPRAIVVASSVMALCGSLIYSIPVSKYCPLLGRVFLGISIASEGVIIGAVSRSTDEDERAKAFLILEGLFSLGCGVGPLVAAIFTFQVNILGWQINAGNSAIFVMLFVWAILTILSFYLPSNFGNYEDLDREDESIVAKGDAKSVLNAAAVQNSSSNSYEYSQILCLFYQMFLSWFFAGVAIFYTPLLAMELLHLDEVHVKLLFTNGTLGLLMLYLALYIATEYFDERRLLLFAISLQIVPIFLLFIFGLLWSSAMAKELSYLLIIYICLGISYVGYPLACSLLSKATPQDQASFYQGLCVTTLNIGIIGGRLIPSFTFTKISTVVFSIVLGFLWTLGLVWYCFVYQRLPAAKNHVENEKS